MWRLIQQSDKLVIQHATDGSSSMHRLWGFDLGLYAGVCAGQQKPRSQSMKEFFVSISAPASRSNAEEARALRSLPSRPYHRPTFFDSPKCKTQSQHEEGASCNATSTVSPVSSVLEVAG